ncbi:MAG: hypothetical protein AAB910_03160 [Patescibacteria group bacterium]
MEFIRIFTESLKPLEDREVVSGVQFSEVSKVGDSIDPTQILGGVTSANQNAWGILIRWNKTKWGIRGFTVEKNEVLEKLGNVYSANKPLTASDEVIFGIIKILDEKAIEVANSHVREINSGRF